MSDLGDRMKLYEGVTRSRLIPKVPVMIRMDGKAFHSITRGCKKPFDETFSGYMLATAQALCSEIAGCKIAYVQSDEISLLLTDYENRDTQGWFDYDLQKLVSVSASLAGARFTIERGVPAAFDSRAWNLPAHEVVNCFIWRQQDATRNSILGLAQAHFSHKQLQGKNVSQLQDMLMEEKGVNWNDCATIQKRGACVVKEQFEHVGESGEVAIRSRWVVDREIPVFTADKTYINRLVGAAL